MKNISSIIVLLTALCLGHVSYAQDAVAQFSQRLASQRAEFTYSFSAGADTKISGGGKAVLQGECFIVVGNGLELRCDGKEVWTIDRKAKEVMAESLMTDSFADLYANPALLVANLGTAFHVKYLRATTVSGKAAAVYALTPKESVPEMNSLTVTLAPDGSAIYSAQLKMKDGTSTTVNIPSFSFLAFGDSSKFKTSLSSFDKSYVVTDLR
ncbi:MAG: outer membrane lipoprotein carrier protein LolA [Bacteroidales bacterium]|nr:outer membrane lipoprotein carrier protein LolA [Bacteroidales bacterium]